MRAALLLMTMLLGVPALPDSLHAGPTRAAGGAPSDATTPPAGVLTAKVLALAAAVLRSTDQAELLVALDRAILGLDLAALMPEGFKLVAASGTDAAARERLRIEAVAELEVTVSPVWRDEVRELAGRMSVLHARGLAHPAIARAASEATPEDTLDVRRLLSDLRRPHEQRQAALLYLRGLMAACAFATSCEEEPVPDPLAASLIPLWRHSVDQLDTLLATGTLTTPDPERPLVSTRWQR